MGLGVSRQMTGTADRDIPSGGQARLASARLLRRGLWLEYLTLGWNVVGSVVILASAARAGSVALAGFGLDSLIEIFASVIVVWQLRGVNKNREAVALRLIGASFFLLALYILVQSAWTVLTGTRPSTSVPGLVWLAVTVVTMLLLAHGKALVGRQLGNAVLETEARVTLIDGALAAAVLVGVGLNALLGWWWADPLAGLVIVYYGFREGREAWAHAKHL